MSLVSGRIVVKESRLCLDASSGMNSSIILYAGGFAYTDSKFVWLGGKIRFAELYQSKLLKDIVPESVICSLVT